LRSFFFSWLPVLRGFSGFRGNLPGALHGLGEIATDGKHIGVGGSAGHYPVVGFCGLDHQAKVSVVENAGFDGTEAAGNDCVHFFVS
jgi:hypothetical protein